MIAPRPALVSVILAAPLAAQSPHADFVFAGREEIGWSQFRPSGMALADLDGDGDLDLVTAGGFLGAPPPPTMPGDRSSYGWFENDGGGRLRWRQTFFDLPATSARPLAVDLDGDGRAEIVYDVQAGAPVVLSASGRSSYVEVTAQWLVPGQGMPLGATDVGDVDGDGDLDLATGSQLLLNDGAGRFAYAAPLPLGLTGLGVARRLVDLDADGDLDLVADGSTVLLQQAPLTFVDVSTQWIATPLRGWLALGDLDGDGDPDLVVSDATPGITVFEHRGTRFAQAATLAAGSYERVRLLDVDGDGRLDIVGSSQAFRNQGGLRFAPLPAGLLPAGTAAMPVTAGDVDGDGLQDLVAAAPNPRLWRNASGRYVDAGVAHVDLEVEGLSVRSLRHVDLDNDGFSDVVSETGREVYTHHSIGAGQFDTRLAFATVSSGTYAEVIRDLAAADLDADGDFDLVLTTSAAAYVAQNAGAGRTWSVLRLVGFPASTHEVAVADVDGDGRPDLIGNGPVLFLNTGAGTFANATATAFPIGFTTGRAALAAGDLDGDGDVDLVFAAATRQLLTNDGAGVFTPRAGLPQPMDRVLQTEIGDLDGDGDLDLVDLVQVQSTGQAYLQPLRNEAPVWFTAGGALLGAAGLAVADFDGDGDLDLVDGVHLRRNAGAFRFTTEAFDRPVVVVGTGDADDDGDVDLWVSGGAGNVSLLAQRSAQTYAPWVAVPGGTYRLSVTSRGADFVLPLLSGGQVRTPIAGLGTLGLPAVGTVAFGVRRIAAPGGSVEYALPVAPLPSLQGLPLYAQSVLLDPATGVLRLSNTLADRIE